MEGFCCNSCKSTFNQDVNYHIMLVCGDSICYSCFINKLDNPKQSSGMAQPQNQQLYTCPICSSQITIPPKIKELVAKIQDTLPTHRVVCSEHPQMLAAFFCAKDNQMVCQSCITSSHQKHPKQVFEITKQDIQQFTIAAKKILIQTSARIKLLHSSLKSLETSDATMPSNEFIRNVTEARTFIGKKMVTDDEKIVQGFLNLQGKKGQTRQKKQTRSLGIRKQRGPAVKDRKKKQTKVKKEEPVSQQQNPSQIQQLQQQQNLPLNQQFGNANNIQNQSPLQLSQPVQNPQQNDANHQAGQQQRVSQQQLSQDQQYTFQQASKLLGPNSRFLS